MLFIQCLKQANAYDREELLNWYLSQEQSVNKVNQITELFLKYHVDDYVKEMVQSYGLKSIEALNTISVPDDRKKNLRTLLTELLHRNK